MRLIFEHHNLSSRFLGGHMKAQFQNLILFISILFSASLASAVCGYEQLTVQNATPEEVTATCDYLERLKTEFGKMDIVVEPKGTIFFEDQAVSPVNGVSVHGYFDSDVSEIHMTHLKAGVNTPSTPFGLVKSVELMETFLLHELIHMYVFAYMGDSMSRITRVWHEALAYSLQFRLMNTKTREMILKYNPSLTAYSDDSYINSMFYGTDPDQFAIRAHLAFENWGGLEYIKDLMDGKIPGTAFEATF